jgi:segregation and condensation protein B
VDHLVESEEAVVGLDGPAAQDRSLPLTALVESMLFVAEEPPTIGRLAQALEASVAEVEAALADLQQIYHANGGRGIRLQRKNDRVQLITAPEAAPLIERFLGLDLSSKLSGAALETLAVIAYRQPLTRAEIEAVRGVSCDGVLRTLVARGLVQAKERLEQAGRPFLYNTTFQFLQYFGLESLDALPPLPDGEERDSTHGGESVGVA